MYLVSSSVTLRCGACGQVVEQSDAGAVDPWISVDPLHHFCDVFNHFLETSSRDDFCAAY